MSTPTLLNQVLSGLHRSDEQIWTRLSGLSGQISGSFVADRIAVGTGTGLSATTYTFGNSIAGENLNTTIVDAQTISSFVQGKVDALANEQGTALTGVLLSSETGALKKADGTKNVTIGLDVDGTTISDSTGTLKSVIKLVKADTAAEGFASTYKLADSTGTPIDGSAEINIPKDQFLSSAIYNATDESIDLTFSVPGATGDQLPALVKIPVSGLVHEFEGVSGVAIVFNANGTTSQIKAVINKSSANGQFLTLDGSGIGLSGITDYVDGKVADAQSDANDGLEALSAALTNYLGENAVSTKFAAVDANIGTLSTQIGDDLIVANSSKVLTVGNDGNIAASEAVLGSKDQPANAFGTTDTTTLATEKAVKNYVAAEIAAADSNITSGLLSANQFVLTDGDKKLATTGLTLDTDMLDGANSATTIPTTLAVQNYIEEGLSGLQSQINTLLGLMGVSNA